MSGLYLLLLIAIWLGLGWVGYRLWRRWAPERVERKRFHAAIGLLLAAAWILVPLWEVGGKKAYYDTQVKRLCKKDGGIKVYETVRLPAEKFDKYGVVRIPAKKDAKSEDEYYYEWDIHYYQQRNPEVWRLHFQILRRVNNKLLGEATSYARRGGDIPGPWHESSFGCPDRADISDLKNQVFANAN